MNNDLELVRLCGLQWQRLVRSGFLCGLTFELTGPAEAGDGWPRRDDLNMAWSGQTLAAVAGPVVERGVRPRYFCWPRPQRRNLASVLGKPR
jgi:hypothetical protein